MHLIDAFIIMKKSHFRRPETFSPGGLSPGPSPGPSWGPAEIGLCGALGPSGALRGSGPAGPWALVGPCGERALLGPLQIRKNQYFQPLKTLNISF